MVLSSTPSNGRKLKPADPRTIQDKFMVGYQGWFTCAGDGPPLGPGHHGWLHWFNYPIPDGGRPNTDLWPDLSDYSPSELYPAPGLKYSNDEQAFLFSSRHPKTVQRHFQWMAEHGVDGAFLQRFAVYGAMWDEYDEGTAFLPVVSKKQQVPVLETHKLELEDYWSTRPRYEDNGVQAEPSTSSEGKSSGYAEWSKALEGHEGDVDVPPPPYTLEMENPATEPVTPAAPAATHLGTSVPLQAVLMYSFRKLTPHHSTHRSLWTSLTFLKRPADPYGFPYPAPGPQNVYGGPYPPPPGPPPPPPRPGSYPNSGAPLMDRRPSLSSNPLGYAEARLQNLAQSGQRLWNKHTK
ncbi:predicted protein [Postia placenta Mad-698-R]|nr:predicted protein [Postia placenta Mad-698-R]